MKTVARRTVVMVMIVRTTVVRVMIVRTTVVQSGRQHWPAGEGTVFQTSNRARA